MTNEVDNPKSIRLYQHEGGSNFSTTDLRIMPDGSLQLSGYDIGEMAQQFVGHEDYEYDMTVAPECKDKLLLALLKAKFGDDSQASGHFRCFLDTENIPYDFDTWPWNLKTPSPANEKNPSAGQPTTKRYLVDFCDEFDMEWTNWFDRRFDTIQEVIEACGAMQAELPKKNRAFGDHWGVINLDIGLEVYCSREVLAFAC
jgi:hypothetical protein